jgi:hypothetical protein
MTSTMFVDLHITFYIIQHFAFIFLVLSQIYLISFRFKFLTYLKLHYNKQFAHLESSFHKRFIISNHCFFVIILKYL